MKIDSIAKVAEKHITSIRKDHGVDFVVTLTHQDISLDRQLVSHQDIDLLLGVLIIFFFFLSKIEILYRKHYIFVFQGHDHEPFIEKLLNKNNKPCWIVKVGKDANFIGMITILVSSG